jgi:hypothetical protein
VVVEVAAEAEDSVVTVEAVVDSEVVAEEVSEVETDREETAREGRCLMER